MVVLAGHEKATLRKIKTLRRPFANPVTRAMVERRAVNLQVRIDRRKAESVSNYQTEYNRILGRIALGGLNHQEIQARAVRDFVATHGQRHLPK